MAYIKLALGIWTLVIAVVAGVVAGAVWVVVRGVRALKRRRAGGGDVFSGDVFPEEDVFPEDVFPNVDVRLGNSRRYSAADRMPV